MSDLADNLKLDKEIFESERAIYESVLAEVDPSHENYIYCRERIMTYTRAIIRIENELRES